MIRIAPLLLLALAACSGPRAPRPQAEALPTHRCSPPYVYAPDGRCEYVPAPSREWDPRVPTFDLTLAECDSLGWHRPAVSLDSLPPRIARWGWTVSGVRWDGPREPGTTVTFCVCHARDDWLDSLAVGGRIGEVTCQEPWRARARR